MRYHLKLSIGQSFCKNPFNLHTTFHRPVRLGDVQVEAKVDRIGKKKRAYVLADLFQNDKNGYCFVVSSVMIL